MALKAAMLIPYCPLPANTGARQEMWKYIDLVSRISECRILSASAKPVGAGWSAEDRAVFKEKGFDVDIRDDEESISVKQCVGVAYAMLCKAFRLEMAFGYRNPYHGSAFPVQWWQKHTSGIDLAIIHYSYWAHLPCNCPKVVVLHDLLSSIMWSDARREAEHLKEADLVAVISRDEAETLRGMGVENVLWSPPLVKRMNLPDADGICLVGSENRFNREGLKWLSERLSGASPRINLYGSICVHAQHASFEKHGRYETPEIPYTSAGIVLIPTALGTGVQIKLIEALAAGRAIVARKGAARGLPAGEGGWVEVDNAADMIEEADRLAKDKQYRSEVSANAKRYYDKYLDSEIISGEFLRRIEQLTRK